MPAKKHRLFTRWFSRRIDLGVILSGCLFVFIWALLPQDPVQDARGSIESSMLVQTTRLPLSAVPAYLRPDLMLVPSHYTFSPVWQMSDVMSGVPRYPYSTGLRRIVSEPAGMGSLAPLLTGLLNHYPIWLLSATGGADAAVGRPPSEPRLHARKSVGLGRTQLRTDHPVWEPELTGAQPWEFSFWIAFHGEGGESTLFVEERSGDLERDLRVLRIVERWDVWDGPSGMGTVWLRYEPAAGGEYAHKDD